MLSSVLESKMIIAVANQIFTCFKLVQCVVISILSALNLLQKDSARNAFPLIKCKIIYLSILLQSG